MNSLKRLKTTYNIGHTTTRGAVLNARHFAKTLGIWRTGPIKVALPGIYRYRYGG